LLSLVQPAAGKIVYTPVNVTLKDNQPFPIDLNHDGKVDFFLLQSFFVSVGGFAGSDLNACHHPFVNTRGYICASSTSATNAQNQVRAIPGENLAAALRAGARIQNGDRFVGKNVAVLMGAVNFPTFTTTRGPTWVGPWVNGGKGVKNRYLGFKFKIKGKFHFGWARLTVATQTKGFTATLTGYAYETVASKAIIAGKTKGPGEVDSQPAPATLSAPNRQSATLGKLALGSPGLSVWRREGSVGSTP
jgi:hypothetical protein